MIKLDVGCGTKKEDGFIGLDNRPIFGVDIVHDITKIPWPLEDNTCHIVLLRRILEYIPPPTLLPVFDELWRIVISGGQLLIASAYAGSYNALNDPLCYRPGFTPTAFQMFDPSFREYSEYKPKPWKIVNTQYDLMSNVNVIMENMKEVPSVITSVRD